MKIRRHCKNREYVDLYIYIDVDLMVRLSKTKKWKLENERTYLKKKQGICGFLVRYVIKSFA